MSNLILTQACNKNCSYCFASDYRHDASVVESEMSLETIGTILDKTYTGDASRISLLGGEPTQHSRFAEILDLCYTKKFKVLLISNFLFNEQTLQKLLQIIADPDKNLSFLINATELRIGTRMETFARNYNTILQAVTDHNKTDSLTCGLTLDGELLTQEGFDNYLGFLQQSLTEIPAMRFSLNYPGSLDGKEKFYFLNNKEFGDHIYYVVRRLLYAGITPVFDCISFPCMYRTPKIARFIRAYIEKDNGYICQGAPADYLTDGTVRYCFPTLSISVNGAKYKTDQSIRSALKNKYDEVLKRATLPEPCITCEYKREGTCHGPCLGFMDLSSILT